MHLIRDLFSIVQTSAQVIVDIKEYPAPKDRAQLFEETLHELHLYRRIRRPWTEDDKVAVTRLEATALATFSGSLALGDTWPQDAINRQLAERVPPESGDPFQRPSRDASWRAPDHVNDQTEVW